MNGHSFQTRVVEQAHHYWTSKCAANRLPSRADLRPEEMCSILPHVFLVEVLQAPLEFRFRLVGTAIDQMVGCNMTGVRVNREEYGPDWQSIFEVYRRVVDSRTPEIATRSAPWPSRDFYVYERFIAPLSTDGSSVDMLFGAIEGFSGDAGGRTNSC